jgi:hypothetical protein
MRAMIPPRNLPIIVLALRRRPGPSVFEEHDLVAARARREPVQALTAEFGLAKTWSCHMVNLRNRKKHP